MTLNDEARIIKYCHWAASVPGFLLFISGILSLLALAFFEQRLGDYLNAAGTPTFDQIMYSGFPGYFAIVVGVILCALCFLQKAGISIASVILSWLLTCLLILLTMVSIVAPFMRLQHQAHPAT